MLGYVMAVQFATVAYYPFSWVHLALVTIMATFVRNEMGGVEAINKEAVKNVDSTCNYDLASLSEKKI